MFTKEYSYGGSELYKNLLRITKFKRIVFGYFIFDEHDFYGKNENSSIINVMIFLYDEEDNIVGVNYRGIFYYYVYDTQGNVISIYDEYGTSSMSYQYDAWGRIRTIYDSGCPLYNVNPITYRGYYYDNDLGLYYLQSRYYNPELCRFISADSFKFISNKTKLNVNAYLYCINNPVNYIDPFGNSYVSKEGKAISDLIAIIFVTLEAEARGLGEDFVYLIASYFTNHVDDLYYKRDKNKKKDQANKRKARAKFDKIFESLVDDFIKLTKTAFYKVVKTIKPNFFFEFFKKSVKEHSDLVQISIDKNITITFGYGVADDFYALIQDIVDRHLKFITIGGVDLGTILGPDLGVYIDHQKEIANDFFASLTIELEGNFVDFYPPNPGAAVNTEYMSVAAYAAIMALIILATGGLVCLV